MNWPDWLPLRPALKPMSAYGAPQLAAKVRINTNENPYGPSDELIKTMLHRISEVAGSLNRYPDRDAAQLRKKLADYLGHELNLENIWAANGSNEIIQSIFLAFGSGSAIGFSPSYSMHPIIAKVTGVDWVDGKRRPDFSFDVDSAIAEISKLKPKLVFITTPNNPTGEAIKLSEIEKLAVEAKQVSALLVVDEAYAEFSNEPSAITLLSNYRNILVLRTMSKAFAFAGARLGYLAADKTVISALQLVRLPYHLSSLTLAAAEVALDYREELLATVSELVNQRNSLADQLTKLGLMVTPSSSNFLLFSGFNDDSNSLWEKLMKSGVLIRDVGLPGYLRVTVGTASENEAFIAALKEVLR